MTKTFFTVTYDTVTPESAETGDSADRGYAYPGGWKHEYPTHMTLREAVNASKSYRGGFEDSGRWFTTVDPDRDYRTGEETQYSVHPVRTITPSSYRRVARVLTGRKHRTDMCNQFQEGCE